MTIASDGDSPVCVANALYVSGSRGAVLRIVVLRTADDIVKRELVIDVDLVELSQR